ncbi:hypothetical protein BN1356_00553 [Streptococcus varani]|uniref:Uncharacterized protein n=1 Tax=Streptococcus varani TaxID=1608583 RepID=A0A0E4H3X1_9STRE|nr:hypothetical protein [Streptococcus varani]CQR24192.1 hypothetical protein BN1356_00553 [Streptococcus varani]
MLKWGMLSLVGFVLLFALSKVLAGLALGGLFMILGILTVFFLFLSMNLLVGAMIGRVLKYSSPYSAFVIAMVIVFFLALLFGAASFNNGASTFETNVNHLTGYAIIGSTIMYQSFLLIGAGIHYVFIGRKKMSKNQQDSN